MKVFKPWHVRVYKQITNNDINYGMTIFVGDILIMTQKCYVKEDDMPISNQIASK